jgi:hypothetical protein
MHREHKGLPTHQRKRDEIRNRVLPAPAMFSGTTGRPSWVCKASARMRPTTSVTPPTPTGMIMRSGRAWANAGAAKPSAAAVRRERRSMGE